MTCRTAAAIASAIAVATIFSATAPAARAEEGKPSWWAPRLRSKDAAPEPSQPKGQDEVPNNPAAAPPKPVMQAASKGARVAPDGSLLKANEKLKAGPIGRDANARAYLDLIGAGSASPAQVNDFAAYLAKRGMPKLALQYQEYAVRMDGNDSTLLLNLGTLHQNLRESGAAENAFQKCIDLDPNNALAHYNLGTVYDSRKSYDAAVEEYRRALVLDPTLGDPRKNPQVVNNEHLLAVKLEIYRNQAGSLGLPLKQMQTDPAVKPAAKDDHR